jgi:hypothetical protein
VRAKESVAVESIRRKGRKRTDQVETDEEDERNTPVAPLVGDLVVVSGREVGGTADDRVSGRGTCSKGRQRGRKRNEDKERNAPAKVQIWFSPRVAG